MSPFTRSRSQEVIAYRESVTKLTASDLLEEGTQCPACWTEIPSFASIYLHRGCANVICSSCFEHNLSRQRYSEICLVCKGRLLEPCTENAIPNWRFTYTDIPLPGSFINSSRNGQSLPGGAANGGEPLSGKIQWPSILSPRYKFHSSGNAWPVVGAYSAVEELSNLSATINMLKADLEQQRKRMKRWSDEEFPNRHNNIRFPPKLHPLLWQGNIDSQNTKHGHNTNRQDQEPNDSWSQKKPNPNKQIGGYFGNGLGPVLAYHHNDSQTRHQHRQPRQRNRNRSPKGKQLSDGRQNDSRTQNSQHHYNDEEHGLFRKGNEKHAIRNRLKKHRSKARLWTMKAMPTQHKPEPPKFSQLFRREGSR